MKYCLFCRNIGKHIVASFAEAWIEIMQKTNEREKEQVASFAEAWIEMGEAENIATEYMSPPSRRRGLKFSTLLLCTKYKVVASFAEAWIEICSLSVFTAFLIVASFAEAWIEIKSIPIVPVPKNGRLLRGGVD